MAEVARIFPKLPSVDRILESDEGKALQQNVRRETAVDAVRARLEEIRGRVKNGEPVEDAEITPSALAVAATAALADSRKTRIRRVVNATGVVVHTNLGRSLLADEAVQAVVSAAREPMALEYDVDEGRRGDRDNLVEEHLRVLTGAEAATVVNNNAAAVLLMLNALGEGREVVVSRGELVEIGGSFRVPDVMAKSGALLREVGTTNRTHPRDYENAIAENTAMLLKVHTSNYKIVGFTASVDLPELRRIADERENLVVAEDLGAGALVDFSGSGMPAEPVVADRVAAGADVVTFSGDKLLGGPQCGLVVGRAALIAKIKANPLKRALRCDKMTLAALEATLRLYRFDPAPEKAIPTLRSLTRPIAELDEIGVRAVTLLQAHLGASFDVALVRSEAQAGSGCQPEVTVESRAVCITSSTESPDRIADRFRGGEPPVIGRIEKDRFLLDLRTIADPAQLVPALS
jgi:L-seryl-tRNA(Ser) seleniumtransferase